MQTTPPTGGPGGGAPPMPTGPLTNPPTPGHPLVPEYWKQNSLPPIWKSDWNIAMFMANQRPVLDRLEALDKQAAAVDQERVFLHNWLRSIPGPVVNS